MEGQNDRFGELVRAALCDEAVQFRLPEDFAPRLVRGVRSVSSVRDRVVPRWFRIAASVAAMISFAAFASWVGLTAGRSDGGVPERAATSAPPADPETEIISNQGENTMIARKMATLVGAAVVSVAVPAETIESEPTFVFLRPETSSFWNTATNSTMTVPVDYPVGAASAELTVRGLNYQCVYKGITANEYTFEVPAATSPETENVYDLTLAFDDGTVRTAKLGLVQGLSPDAEGTARCLAPEGAKVWNRINGKAVLPMPYGMRSFKVNGEAVDTGLDGAQGWYALGRIDPDEAVSLEMETGSATYVADLLGGGAGLLMIVR